MAQQLPTYDPSVFTRSLAPYSNPYAAQRAGLQSQLDAVPQGPYSDQEIAQRQQQNQHDYQLGLLGMLSGDQTFTGVGGQIFKQALAGRQPEVTDKGVYDPISGKYRLNEEARRANLQSQMERLDTLDAQARLSYEKDIRDYQTKIEENRQRALDRAALAAAGGGGAQQARLWHEEDNLRNNFESLTKTNRDTLTEVGNIKTLMAANAGRHMDPISQQSVVVMLNKFLDPGSVVREGEFNRVIEAQGLLSKVKMLKDKYDHGDVLSPDTINQISNLADIYQQAHLSKIRQVATNSARVAASRGLNPGAVITNPDYLPTAATAPPPPPPPGPVDRRTTPDRRAAQATPSPAATSVSTTPGAPMTPAQREARIRELEAQLKGP